MERGRQRARKDSKRRWTLRDGLSHCHFVIAAFCQIMLWHYNGCMCVGWEDGVLAWLFGVFHAGRVFREVSVRVLCSRL